MARLEEQLDARLFNRTTRRLSLTEDGETFLAGVREGLERFEAAEELLRAKRSHASGTLKVLLPNTFCKNYIMPELPAFMRKYPDISFELHVDDFGADLLQGGYELSVQFGRPPDTNYITRYLGSTQVVLAASPDYIRRMGAPRSIAELDRHECIQLRGATSSTAFPWHLTRAANAAPGEEPVVYRPKGRCFINSQFDTAIFAAVQGVGITPIDLVAAERFLREGTLQIVLPEYELARGGELFLLYPHRDHVSLRCRAFIDFVVEVAQKTLVKRPLPLGAAFAPA